MGKGSFTSYLKPVQKDLHKAEAEVLKEASKHLVKKMRAKIKPMKHSGNLSKGLGYKLIIPAINVPKDPFALVGASSPGYHLHIIELGTKERRQSKTGKKTGKVKPTHFMTKTFHEEAGETKRILEGPWI